MTLLHFDGFDQYGTTADFGSEYVYGGAVIPNTTAGRFGGGCMTVNGNNALWVRKPLGAGYTDLWQGFSLKIGSETGPGNAGICSFLTANGFEVGVDFNSSTNVFTTGRVDGSSFGKIGTVLGTSAAQLFPATSYNWIEFRAVFGSGTSGALEVWLNGVQIINVTGISTNRTGATGGYTEGWMGTRNGFDSTGNRFFDDWYIATSRLGDCKVVTLAPNSDATPNVGTPSTAGAHYLMVNETIPNLTNYVSLDASSAGNKEMFGITSISTTQSVLGVKVSAFAAKSDTADAIFAAILKSGSTEVVGGTVGTLIGSNAKSGILAELDPNTGAAWTQTGVNAMNVGAKTL